MPVDELICAALRGERPLWRQPDDAAATEAILSFAEVHGVTPLLHEQLHGGTWPQDILQALRDRAVQQAMWELRHQQLLAQTLAVLDDIGVRPVLIKGTAMAYSLYANPVMRTRADTDLIIPREAKGRTHDALVSLGYERNPGVSGDFVSYQSSYTRQTPDGGAHTLDLHWKINNSEVLSRLFTYDELFDDARPLPQLCAHALGASPVHALLLACMHRSTHKQNPYYVNGEQHHDANRLIWLYDIHLLACELNSPDWAEFIRLAEKKGLRAICLEGMQQAQGRFRTPYPEAVLAALTHPGRAEPAAKYLGGGRWRQQWMDFCALDSFSRQVQWAGESLLPSAGYMRGKYSDQPDAWLPWLYVRRAAQGVAKRLSRNSPGP